MRKMFGFLRFWLIHPLTPEPTQVLVNGSAKIQTFFTFVNPYKLLADPHGAPCTRCNALKGIWEMRPRYTKAEMLVLYQLLIQ